MSASVQSLEQLKERLVERQREDLLMVDQVIELARALEAPVSEAPLAPGAARNGKGQKGAKSAKPVRTAGKAGNKIDPRSLPNLRVIAKLAEPFGAKDVQRVTRLDNANSLICAYLKRGWLERVGVGQHTRTTKFPRLDNEPAAEKAPAANGGESRSKLEKQLQDALKGRDAARESGRDEVVEIYQRDIERIEALLE